MSSSKLINFDSGACGGRRLGKLHEIVIIGMSGTSWIDNAVEHFRGQLINTTGMKNCKSNQFNVIDREVLTTG